MPLDTSAIERSCKSLRRQVMEEFPDLTVQFIVYKGGNIDKSIEGKRGELLDHPAGTLFFPALKKLAKTGGTPAPFCGLAWQRGKKLLPFMAKRKALACFLVNAENYGDEDILRQDLFHRLWHALNLFLGKDYGASREPNGLLIPPQDKETQAWHAMLADAFAALALETQGKKGAIRQLARQRSAAALEARPHHNANDYPFPLIADATVLVCNEMRSHAMNRDHVLLKAYEMTHEIAITFGPDTVLQWWAFTKPAQDMAWLDLDKNRILGAAVHGSEDPYARSTAYLVAEALTLDPTLITGTALYNLFCDPEVNERHHYKLCEETFQIAMEKAPVDRGEPVLRSEAARNHKKLLSGQIIGWCAPALLAVADSMGSDPGDAPRNSEKLKEIFDAMNDKINTGTLDVLAHIIIELKQSGEKVTNDTIAEKAFSVPSLSFIDFTDLKSLETAQ